MVVKDSESQTGLQKAEVGTGVRETPPRRRKRPQESDEQFDSQQNAPEGVAQDLASLP